MALTAAIGLWLQFESSQSQLRSSLLEQADRRAIQLSDAVSEQFHSLLRNTDFTLRELRQVWLAQREGIEVDYRSLELRFPEQSLLHISLVGPDGVVEFSTLDIAGRRDFVDLAAIQRRAEQDADLLHIGSPVYSKILEQWLVPVSLPILEDNKLLGFLQAGLAPEYLSKRLAEVNIAKQDIIVFLDKRGAFLARNMELEKALGKTVKTSRPFLAKDAPVNGVFHAPATLDAIPRIFGWTIQQQYGVITVVGLAQNDLLVPYTQQYAQERWRNILITLIILFFGVGVSHLLFRLSREQEALGVSRESLSEAQRIAHLGNWELDLTRNQLTWSDEIYRIFGMEPQQFGANYEAFLEAIHPDDRDEVNEQYKNAIEKRLPYDIEHRIVRRDDGRVRWVHERCEYIYNSKGEVVHCNGTVQDITERKQLESELRELATTDFLTGLPTRRNFMDRLEDELARFYRTKGQPVSVAVVDLDRFKQINDEYGHTTGDQLLQHFAKLVSGELRRIDMVGRLGGDEFGLVLPGTNSKDAGRFADRLRKRIADSPLTLDGQHIGLSISIGVTELCDTDKDPVDVIERADKALYLAKERGRNRIEVQEID